MKYKIINNKIGTIFPLPTQSDRGAAGFDLVACLDDSIHIKPSETMLIPSGIAIHIDDVNICGLIVPRSGLAHKHGIIVTNSPGLIDSSYTGEWFISLRNVYKTRYKITPGDKVAQVIFMSVISPVLEETTSFENTQRGSNGFGSTGK